MTPKQVLVLLYTTTLILLVAGQNFIETNEKFEGCATSKHAIIISKRAVYVPDFNYNCKCKNPVFKSGERDYPAACHKIGNYKGIYLTLASENNSTVKIVCKDNNKTLSRIDVTNQLPDNGYYPIILNPFSTLAHSLKSGPIAQIDKNQFFIPELFYDGKGPDAYFWMGNGSSGPNTHGKLVPDENNSREVLKSYTGQNIILTLPTPYTARDIEYLGIWCVTYKHNFGYTEMIPARTSNCLVPAPVPINSASAIAINIFNISLIILAIMYALVI